MSARPLSPSDPNAVANARPNMTNSSECEVTSGAAQTRRRASPGMAVSDGAGIDRPGTTADSDADILLPTGLRTQSGGGQTKAENRAENAGVTKGSLLSHLCLYGQ